MRLLGACCLLAFALLATRAFSGYEMRRVQENEGVLSLLLYLRSAIKTYAMPLDTLYAEVRCEALERSGFLSVLRREGLSAALRSVPPVGMEEKTICTLLRFGDQLGSRFLEDEVAALDEVIPQLSEALSHMMGEAPRRKKIGRALITTASMMVLLLFV